MLATGCPAFDKTAPTMEPGPMQPAQAHDKPLIRYLVLGCPRSGTTVIHMAMKGHPRVSTLSDEMETIPFFSMGLGTFTCGEENTAERKGGHLALFDAITSITAQPGTTHRGAKVCARSPGEAVVLVEALRTYLPDIRVILTIRDDLVAQYGSLCKARRSNVWHSWNPGASAARDKKLRMNGWLFRRYALNTMDTIGTLRTLSSSHRILECPFEKLLTNADDLYREAFKFLDLDPRPVDWLKARKVNPPPGNYIFKYAKMTRILEALRHQHESACVPGHVRAINTSLDRISKTYYWFRPRR